MLGLFRCHELLRGTSSSQLSGGEGLSRVIDAVELKLRPSAENGLALELLPSMVCEIRLVNGCEGTHRLLPVHAQTGEGKESSPAPRPYTRSAQNHSPHIQSTQVCVIAEAGTLRRSRQARP